MKEWKRLWALRHVDKLEWNYRINHGLPEVQQVYHEALVWTLAFLQGGVVI